MFASRSWWTSAGPWWRTTVATGRRRSRPIRNRRAFASSSEEVGPPSLLYPWTFACLPLQSLSVIKKITDLLFLSFRSGQWWARQQCGRLGGGDHWVFYQRRNHSPWRSVVPFAGKIISNTQLRFIAKTLSKLCQRPVLSKQHIRVCKMYIVR